MGLFDKLLKKVTTAAENGAAKGVMNVIGGILGNEEEEKVTEISFKKPSTPVSYAEEEIPIDPATGMPYNRTPLKLVKEHKEPVQYDHNAIGSTLPHVDATTTLMYFTDLIQKNLPEFTVKQFASVESVLGSAPEKNVPITLLLSNGTSPALAIFLVPRDKYKPRALIESMNACENAGIPAIRFINEFENEPGYVIGRIKTVLG